VSSGIATIVDVARRRIPNALSLGTAVVGVTSAASGVTEVSLWSSVAGLALGLALMLPGHVIGGTGAGDVKLFAALGSVLGAGRMVEAFLFVAVAGGVVALATACTRGRVCETVSRTAMLLSRPVSGPVVIAPGQDNSFPYAPAIAAGCVLAALRPAWW